MTEPKTEEKVPQGKGDDEEDEEYDPHKHREVHRPTTDIETLIHIVNGCFGTGIMATPQAFMFVGLAFGFVSTVIIGLFCVYTMHILIRTEYRVCKMKKVGVLDYQAAGRCAMEVGPKKLQKYAKCFGYLIDTLMVTQQLGLGCIYIVFVSKNVKRFADSYMEKNFAVVVWMMILLPAFILSILIPDMKWLAPFSTLGNITTLVSFGIISYYTFSELPSIDDRDLFILDGNYPLYFGITIFALESIGVITTAEQNMKRPEHFLSCFGVLNIGMFINTSVYILLGFCGYWRYGPDTTDSITLNIPHKKKLAQVAIMLYVLAIFFSYSLQCYVGNHIFWTNYVSKLFPNAGPRRLCCYEYIFRMISVLFTFILSVAIPLLGLFISLIGSLCMASLAFVIPCIMDLCLRWPDELGKYRWVLCHHIVVMIIGIIGILSGTYCAIRSIVITLMTEDIHEIFVKELY